MSRSRLRTASLFVAPQGSAFGRLRRGQALPRGVALCVFCLVLAASLSLPRADANAATPVSGSVTEDTTWTAANSPYVLTGDVLVQPDVTLTIEPGVRVQAQKGAGSGGRFSGAELEVRGKLIADGTVAAPIDFFPPPEDPYSGWGGITLFEATGKSQLDHIDLAGSGSGLWINNSDAAVSNSMFWVNGTRGVAVTGGARTWDVSITGSQMIGSHSESFTDEGSGVVVGGTGGATGKITVAGNEMYSNTVGLRVGGHAHAWDVDPPVDAYDNKIHSNTVGVKIEVGGPVSTYRNEIYDNALGLRLESPEVDVQHNAITQNDIGVGAYFSQDPSALVFAYNNLNGNSQYAWDQLHGGGYDVTVPNNWWGTTDPQQIETVINDEQDDFLRHRVHYMPVLESPDATAPDSLPPDVAIPSGPSGTMASGSATFEFTTSEPGPDSSFECSLDGSAWDPCSPPKSYSSLADGDHTFSVLGKDAKGNTGSASRAWTVDTTPPAQPTLSGTDPTSPSSQNSPKVTGSAEAASTVRLYTNANCSGPPVATGLAQEFASPGLQVSVPSNATTTFKATATDAAGNASGCSTNSLAYIEDSTTPAQPTLSGTDPTSPSSQNSPKVTGSAEAASTVRLYTNANCSGPPVATGLAQEFASPGLQVSVPSNTTTTFKATATDAAGNASGCSSSSVNYTGMTSLSPPFSSLSPLFSPLADTIAPVFSGVSLSATAFYVGSQSTAIAAARVRTGTTIRYTLSEAAAVRLVIDRKLAGRRRGRRCVPPTRALRRAKKCARYSRTGVLARAGKAGANSVPSSGRIGRKPLVPGYYRLTAEAKDAGGNSAKIKRLSFHIVAKPSTRR